MDFDGKRLPASYEAQVWSTTNKNMRKWKYYILCATNRNMKDFPAEKTNRTAIFPRLQNYQKYDEQLQSQGFFFKWKVTNLCRCRIKKTFNNSPLFPTTTRTTPRKIRRWRRLLPLSNTCSYIHTNPTSIHFHSHTFSTFYPPSATQDVQAGAFFTAIVVTTMMIILIAKVCDVYDETTSSEAYFTDWAYVTTAVPKNF